MLVRAGERVGSDGVVEQGRSAIDTAAITGESVPVEVGPGDQIYAGSINGTVPLTVRATAAVADNSLAKVVAVVEQAQQRKGATQRIADRIARPLVPAILILAGLIALTGSLLGDPATWIERALVVLVAASPCALAISVPVTVVAAVGAASKIGVLIKGGAALESLGAVARSPWTKPALSRGTNPPSQTSFPPRVSRPTGCWRSPPHSRHTANTRWPPLSCGLCPTRGRPPTWKPSPAPALWAQSTAPRPDSANRPGYRPAASPRTSPASRNPVPPPPSSNSTAR